MKEQKQWEEALSHSPFVNPRFTEQLRDKIIDKANHKPKKKTYIARLGTVSALVAVLVYMLFAADLSKLFTNPSKIDGTIGSSRGEEARTEYRKNGKVIFQVFPEENVVAGADQGYVIHFTQPIDVFLGKKISIEGYHSLSGKRLIVMPPVIITEPSSGYETLERFTTGFSLPIGGTWRFEVKLNEQYYGDFVLAVQEPSPWRSTSTFNLPYTGNDGMPYNYVLAGEKDKVGFLVGPYQNDKGELLEQQPIIAGKGNKYMWHFWGSKEELEGSFNVMAVKEGTTREIDVFSARGLGGPLNGADAANPSSMELPEAGMWRLNVYIHDQLFSSIYVRVEPAN
jgi:hypothetical protein